MEFLNNPFLQAGYAKGSLTQPLPEGEGRRKK